MTPQLDFLETPAWFGPSLLHQEVAPKKILQAPSSDCGVPDHSPPRTRYPELAERAQQGLCRVSHSRGYPTLGAGLQASFSKMRLSIVGGGGVDCGARPRSSFPHSSRTSRTSSSERESISSCLEATRRILAYAGPPCEGPSNRDALVSMTDGLCKEGSCDSDHSPL